MKKEWTEQDFDLVYKTIRDYIGGKRYTTHTGKSLFISKPEIEDVLGLPYTSSSSYAMLSMDCNVHIHSNDFKSYHFDHVGIDDNGSVVLVLMNSKEHRILITITN